MPKATHLKVRIVQQGLTMKEVARRIARHETEVCRWANDTRRCPAHVRRLLARELDTTVEALWPDEQPGEQRAAA